MSNRIFPPPPGRVSLSPLSDTESGTVGRTSHIDSELTGIDYVRGFSPALNGLNPMSASVNDQRRFTKLRPPPPPPPYGNHVIAIMGGGGEAMRRRSFT